MIEFNFGLVFYFSPEDRKTGFELRFSRTVRMRVALAIIAARDNHRGENIYHLMSPPPLSLFLVIDPHTYINAHNRPVPAARTRMLPTDQSGLIELRFAVLRPANDRRDISAASGVFAR